MQNYNYFYLNEINISSIRKRCAEYLKELRRRVNTDMSRDAKHCQG